MTALHPFGPESYAAYASVIASGAGRRIDWLGLLETLPPDEADAFARGVRDEVLRRPHDPAADGLAEVVRIWPIRYEHQRKRAGEEASVAGKEAGQRFGWLRQEWLSYAAQAVLYALLGEPWPDDESAVRLAIAAVARRVDVPAAVADQMAAAIWREGADVAARFHQALRRRIWPLCASRVPGAQILAAANDVHERFGGRLLDGEALLAECRRVAVLSIPKRRRHRVNG